MRLFLALGIPEEITEEMKRWVSPLRAKGPELRWAAAETWHVTLQFFGRTNEDQYGCLVERLSEVESEAVEVRIAGTGFFDRAGVFFADVAVTAELLALQQRVTAATRACGFEPEPRPYTPHITLARSRGRSGAGPLAGLKTALRGKPAMEPGRFRAEEALLYESVALPAGSRYEVRERFRFAGR